MERARLAKIALAAWVNVDPDKLPAEKMWIEHPNDLNRQAWDRVVGAIIAAAPPSTDPVPVGGDEHPTPGAAEELDLPHFVWSRVDPGEMDYTEVILGFGSKEGAEAFRRIVSDAQAAARLRSQGEAR